MVSNASGFYLVRNCQPLNFARFRTITHDNSVQTEFQLESLVIMYSLFKHFLVAWRQPSLISINYVNNSFSQLSSLSSSFIFILLHIEFYYFYIFLLLFKIFDLYYLLLAFLIFLSSMFFPFFFYSCSNFVIVPCSVNELVLAIVIAFVIIFFTLVSLCFLLILCSFFKIF